MRTWTALILPLAVAACGGGGGSDSANPSNNSDGGTLAKVGGNVFGLHGSGLTLQIGQGETVAIQKDGAFTFPTSLAPGARYDVKVVTSPKSPAQLCDVTNGSGSVAASDVDTISVSCHDTPLHVGGAIFGLQGAGLRLLLKSGAPGQPLQDVAELPSGMDGSFLFPPTLADGNAYEVTVTTQPSMPLQSCAAANNTGTLDGHDATAVSITCKTTFTLGGTVTGLHGHGLVLRNNDGDDLDIATDGSFTFNTRVAEAAAFKVTVATQPSHILQTCFVTNGTGTVSGDLTGVKVTCNASRQLGTDGDDEAHAALLDASLNLYVAGTTTGNFGGPNAGGSDAVLIKLDWDGTLLWKRQFGSAGNENINAIAFSSTGDLYLVGSTSGSIDGDTNAGSDDILIAKYDKDGNKLWAHSFGSAGSDVARSLRVTSDGLYVVGHTTGSLDGTTTPGDTDLFVAKLDADGNRVWVRQMGSPAFDAAYGVDVDPFGAIYVAGSTFGDLDGHANTSGGEVGFLLEYDALGNLQSSALFCQVDCFGPSAHFQSHFSSVVWVIGLGPMMAGWVRGDPSAEFPNQAALLVAASGSGGPWLQRGAYRSTGNIVASQLVQGKADGMLYMTGYAESQAAPGRKRAFVKQIIAATLGQRYEATVEPPAGDEVGLSMQTDPLGNAWMVGYATTGLDGNASLGGRDIFIRRFNINGDLQ